MDKNSVNKLFVGRAIAGSGGLLVLIFALISGTAQADSLSSADSPVNSQSATPGTQQASTNFNISGTGLATRFSISGLDSGVTDYFDVGLGNTSATLFNFQNSQGSLSLAVTNSGSPHAYLFLGRINNTSDEDIIFNEGLTTTLGANYFQLGRINDTGSNSLRLVGNSSTQDHLKFVIGATGTGYSKIGNTVVLNDIVNCDPRTDADVCIGGVRSNKTTMQVSQLNGTTGHFFDFKNGAGSVVAYYDSSANLFLPANGTVDTAAAGSLTIGGTNANAITIASSGVTTAVAGNLTVKAGGAIDTAAAGSLTIGGTNANAVNIAKAGVTTTVKGPMILPVSIDTDVSTTNLTLAPATANFVVIGSGGHATTLEVDQIQQIGGTLTIGNGSGSTIVTVGGSTFTVNAATGSIVLNGPITVSPFTTAGYVKTSAAGLLSGGNTVENDFSAFSSANLGAATALSQSYIVNASTYGTGSTLTTDVAGVGAGNLVVELCSDGTTCAAGNVYLTCTTACTAVSGFTVSCAITKASIAAATTVTWSIQTACATTEPVFNVNAHRTTP